MSIKSSSGAYGVACISHGIACISAANMLWHAPSMYAMPGLGLLAYSWLLLMSASPSIGQSDANKHDKSPSQNGAETSLSVQDAYRAAGQVGW